MRCRIEPQRLLAPCLLLLAATSLAGPAWSESAAVAADALQEERIALEPLLGIALATFASEDLTCIAVGGLVGQGRLPFTAGTLACLVGIYVGDVLLYLAGRLFGRRAIGVWPFRRWLSPERVRRASGWLEARGPEVVLLARFLPGTRLPTYFAAGLLRTSFWRFHLWFLLAALVWTPLVVWLAAELGGVLSERLRVLGGNLTLGLVATVGLGLLLVRALGPLATYRGRRLWAGRWRGLVRWEYWPRWAFYPPVVLACLLHGLRRRSLLAFTASNPGIPHGGLLGESKADILRALAAGGSVERLARTLVVPGGDLDGEPGATRKRAVRAFRERHALPWPLVVKPDVGQRGDGVRIVRSEAELVAACRALPGRVLVQEFVPGPEFGLFYVRRPGAGTGELLSIARKRLPEVVGDGVRTLEELILADPRAVAHAPLFLAREAEQLALVPEVGERVLLGELGTHCRGAAFLEGRDLETAELLQSVEEVLRGFPGFHFGRFDVRAASEAELRRGAFRVLELNGVSSEAAHVYDPRCSVLAGWRTIAAQWRLAYDVGLANARLGAHVSAPRELVESLRAYRRLGHGRPIGSGAIEEVTRPRLAQEARA